MTFRVVIVLMTVAVLSYVCALDVLFDNRNPNRLLGRDIGRIRFRVGNDFSCCSSTDDCRCVIVRVCVGRIIR
jgi:hypothetical protein